MSHTTGAERDLFNGDALDPIIPGTAEISSCGLYRYRLTRRWGQGGLLTFVMLNPSVANAFADDPTIRRCVGFAKREGAAGLQVVNLLAYRATDPQALYDVADPQGPENVTTLGQVIDADDVVCAWGAHTFGIPYALRFIIRARRSGKPLHCLGRTKNGHPRHPLYVRADQPLEPFP